MDNFTQDIVKRILDVTGRPPAEGFPLHAPEFRGNELKYVQDCIETGWVSSVGSYVDRFERDLSAYTGSPHTVVTVNGTAALHLACVLAGVEAQDEVLMPALTFVATANAVSYTGAIPHFVDSEEVRLGVCPEKLETYLREIAEKRQGSLFNKMTQRRIKALVVMHTFGLATDMPALLRLCGEFHLELIEDAAEALGSFAFGRHLGTLAPIGVLSFNGNKVVTTGGGGALLIRDPEMAKRAKHLSTTGKRPHPWAFEHDMIAYNYRLPNLNAALGCAQLESLPRFLSQKRELAQRYQRSFADCQGAQIIADPAESKSNRWLNALLLDSDKKYARDEILRATNEMKLMTRPVWKLMNELPMYKSCPRMDLSVARELEQRIVNLPSSASLGAKPQHDS